MTVQPAAASPFAAVLGAAFFELPASTRHLHGAAASSWCGEGSVLRGRGHLSRLCGWAARLPPAAPSVPVRLQVQPDAAGGQTWQRHFGTAVMPSQLCADRGLLRERLGALTFWFALDLVDGGIGWQVRRVRLGRWLVLPARLFRQVRAWSGADHHGRYRFDVQAQLPGVGLLVRYHGWLEPVAMSTVAVAAAR